LKHLKFLLTLTIGFLLNACTTFFYAPMQNMNEPMNRVEAPKHTGQRASVLLVMLPGAYDAPKDFIEQGFVKALVDQALDVDLTLLDAHIAYYTSQQIVERLHKEVIGPAKAKGYAQIWLVGISLGGYGSLLYSMRGAHDIDGIFIMAPFMGSRHLPAEVAKAGGLLTWTPVATEVLANAQTPAKLDIDDELWSWLKLYVSTPPLKRKPKIYLGYGLEDRFAGSNRLLAVHLPAEQRLTVPGGHTWAPWLALWNAFLRQRPWLSTQ
jgi:hypothetical protein